MTSTTPRTDVPSIALMIVGALAVMISPVVGMTLATTASVPGVLGNLSSQIEFTATTTIDTSQSGTFFIYSSARDLPDAQSCTVTQGDADAIGLVQADRQQNTNVGWNRYESFARFSLGEDSTATVTCPAEAGELVVGREFSADTYLDSLGPWTLIGGGVTMATGITFIAVGLIRRTRGPTDPLATGTHSGASQNWPPQ